MTTLVIIIALVVIVGGYFISTQRSLVNLDELCKNALSQIEVQLNAVCQARVGDDYPGRAGPWRQPG